MSSKEPPKTTPYIRVLHVIPSLDARDGGPTTALHLMTRSLVSTGVNVDVVATLNISDARRDGISLGSTSMQAGVQIRYFKRDISFYKISMPLLVWLRRHIHEYDLVHIHAVFSFSSAVAGFMSLLQRVPYVITPHGILNPWGMSQRRPWIKKLFFRCVDGPVLRGAAGIHYTSDIERRNAEQVGANAPGIVIPLGTDLDDGCNLSPNLFLEKFPCAEGQRLILALSRIDPVKGLDVLISSFAKLHPKNPNTMLVIAGSGESLYMSQLQSLATRLGVGDQVLWTGHLDEALKKSAFAAATIYTMPSHSENFGLAAVEALASGTPSVLSTGVAIAEDICREGACVMVDPNAHALCTALQQLLSSPATLAALASKARKMARERYSTFAMGSALRDWYLSLLRYNRSTVNI